MVIVLTINAGSNTKAHDTAGKGLTAPEEVELDLHCWCGGDGELAQGKLRDGEGTSRTGLGEYEALGSRTQVFGRLGEDWVVK